EFNAHTNIIFCLAWHPGGERIASAGWDGRQHTVQVWDARNGEEAFALSPAGRAPAFYALAFHPDRPYLVTGSYSGEVQVWDARPATRVGPLGARGGETGGGVSSRDGRHLASASSDGEVNLWDATRRDEKSLDEKQEPRLTLRARVPGPSLNVAFS